MSPTVRWMSMFVDSPPALFDTSAAFWTAVTHTLIGPAVGDDDEFLPLEPVRGDPCLWLQRTREGAPTCHPDLYVEDVDEAAQRARDLGARTRQNGRPPGEVDTTRPSFSSTVRAPRSRARCAASSTSST